MKFGRFHRAVVLAVIGLTFSLALVISTAANPSLMVGSPAFVVNTEGDGLNLRSSPSTSASIVAGMPEGALVEILSTGMVDDTGRAWAEIRFGRLTGFSAASYLTGGAIGTGPFVISAPAGFSSGTLATVNGTGGDGLNVRSAAGSDAKVLTAVPEGTPALVLSGPELTASGDAWYQVETWGTTGWVHGGFLKGVAEPKPSGEPGQDLVAEAMLYLDTPYAWAGTTPAGFDCSGFTYYVVNRVLSNNFPRALDRQLAVGTPVDAADLRAGDLVFFENTYQPGLSHVGIYVADGLFINAGNEDDIVGISNMRDEYWSVRFLAARRVTS